MSSIECGGTSNTAMKRLRELETLSEELEKQIRIEKAQSAFKLSRQEIADFYEHALRQEPQMLINLLISGNISHIKPLNSRKRHENGFGVSSYK